VELLEAAAHRVAFDASARGLRPTAGTPGSATFDGARGGSAFLAGVCQLGAELGFGCVVFGCGELFEQTGDLAVLVFGLLLESLELFRLARIFDGGDALFLLRLLVGPVPEPSARASADDQNGDGCCDQLREGLLAFVLADPRELLGVRLLVSHRFEARLLLSDNACTFHFGLTHGFESGRFLALALIVQALAFLVGLESRRFFFDSAPSGVFLSPRAHL
jgi:hypothetical protein